jgi:tRNA A37 methylthiotransferase MiaB
MDDDITPDVKASRLQEIIATFRANVQIRNDSIEKGRLRLVLVEGESKKSSADNTKWGGRTDQNKRIVFPVRENNPMCWDEDAMRGILDTLDGDGDRSQRKTELIYELARKPKVPLRVGDYAVVQVTEARGHTLIGRLLWRATMTGFRNMRIEDGRPINSMFTI